MTTPNKNGKYDLTFKVQDREPEYRIPCGKCVGCRADKRREWGIRMYHESQDHERSCFVTLTYNDENCPRAINTVEPRNFIKRLRRAMEPDQVRYFLTGEYGEKTLRPHYHAIIFGADFLGGAYDIDDQLYGNPILDALWGRGHVAIGEFNVESAMYTAGYVAKKQVNADTFSIMSKRPPLGMGWMRRNHDTIKRRENVIVEGREYPIPRTYLSWLDGFEDYLHIKENRKAETRFATDKELDGIGSVIKAKTKLKAEVI